MVSQATKHEVHVIVLPGGVQGHINPMVQFSKQLTSRGLIRVTLAICSGISSKLTSFHQRSTVIETIDDGSDEIEDPKDVNSIVEKFNLVGPQSLARLIERKIELGHSVKCLVYDSNIPWGLDVARKFGIYGASFFTQSGLVSSIYYQVYMELLSAPIERSISLPGIPLIDVEDLPSMVRKVGHSVVENLVFDQFSNCEDADWRFINTFDSLEPKVLDFLASQWIVKTIGPAIPSMYLDKRLPEDKEYGLSLFKPERDACIEWLNNKENGSVVYISMGSMASLGEHQMEEIAMGLKECDKHFLWVVRASEENKLPLNFKENTSETGLIVTWCSQLEVMAHEAIGCFVTHCGWNSTLEALSLGVPMVAVPQWTDQPTNAKCITDIWKTGVRVKMNENGLVTRNQIESCIREVMDGEKAKEIKSNASKWKQLAKEAMEEGGSSDRNIDEFVAKLLSS